MKKVKNKKMLHIFINKICNMNCSYCYWDTHENEVMKNAVSNKVIAYLKNTNSYDTLVFFGGEPMLSTDIMIKFIQLLGNKYRYIVMTNGSIDYSYFLDTILNNIDKSKIVFNISYEGINQGIRKNGTNEIIEKNINILKHREIMYTIVNIITPLNCKNIVDNYIYISKLTDAMMLLRVCDLRNNWDKDSLNSYIESFDKIVDISTFFDIIQNKSTVLSNRVENLLNMEFVSTRGHVCQNSLKNCDTCGIDGKKYLCEVAYAKNEAAYGYLWEDKDINIVNINWGYQDCLYHYCIYYGSVCLEFDRKMDMMRVKYRDRVNKLWRLKNDKFKQNVISTCN